MFIKFPYFLPYTQNLLCRFERNGFLFDKTSFCFPYFPSHKRLLIVCSAESYTQNLLCRFERNGFLFASNYSGYRGSNVPRYLTGWVHFVHTAPYRKFALFPLSQTIINRLLGRVLYTKFIMPFRKKRLFI